MGGEGKYLCQGQEGRGSNDVGYYPRARNLTTPFSSRAPGLTVVKVKLHPLIPQTCEPFWRKTVLWVVFQDSYSRQWEICAYNISSKKESARLRAIGLCLSLAWISVEVRMWVTTQEQST